MKIAITGHTKGIGKAIADVMSPENEIFGFSKSNGFDIALPLGHIVEQIKKCDVFVNNAFYQKRQSVLFNSVLEEWFYDQNKTIVNINSRARYGDTSKAYSYFKQDLFTQSLSYVNNYDRKCRVINISPGYVSTERIIEAELEVPIEKMLTPNQFAEMVKWTINQPQNVEIAELSVWVNMAFELPANPEN